MPEGACQPSWSPDGKSLAFISPCLESREDYPGAGLWVLELENLEPRPLPSEPGGDYDPAWSPGGDRIAFASEREGRPQIYVMSLDSDVVVQVHDFFAREVQPSWSPADNLLLFVSYRNSVPQLWSMSDSGENALRFARGDREDTHPAWSSDGQQILFQRRLGGIPRLFATRFADHGVPDFQVCQQAPYAAQPMAEPDFAPDGRWLVFEYWPDGINHNIAIMTASCTIITNLTTEASLDFDPAWRP
jgi:Tol biopolymer transport system component